jgi:hypothetical protein
MLRRLIAPSTMLRGAPLRMVPLPRCAGEDEACSQSRSAAVWTSTSAADAVLYPPPRSGGGGPRGATCGVARWRGRLCSASVALRVRLVASFSLAGLLALVIASSPARAGSPEEDFRGGLSAFNRGDYAAAMRLWRPLAETDDARSQAGIGFMYHRGLGVAVDDAQAAFWLRKAAEQGQAEGQLMLGNLYFFGLGVPQSYPAAYAWCELAQDNGQGEAEMCRDAALASIAGDEERRAAFRMVRELRERVGRARAKGP